jgi:hypothetical protein
MNFKDAARMFQDDLTKSITGQQYDTQVPMRRPEQEQNPRMEALRGIASRSPQQQTQIPEDMNFFNADQANADVAKSMATGKAQGGVQQIAGITNDNMSTEEVPQKLTAPEKVEDRKDNSKMVGAIGDLGKALARPTGAVDVGQYSTFRPEDTMGDIRRQVLESLRARG